MRTAPAFIVALGLAALPLAGQSIVNSWQVAPVGSAFAGGLEYDCVTDTVWVADESNDVITAYDGAGTFIVQYPAQAPAAAGVTNEQPIGVGLDPNTGMLWIGDEGELVYETDPATGLPTGVWWSTQPTITDVSGVAVDPITGHVYISQDSGTRTIAEFDQTGAVINTINLTASGSMDPDGLAYNTATGTYYLGDDTADTVHEVDAAGVLLNSWPLGGMGISPEGLGVDLVNGLLYVGDGFVTRSVYVLSGIVASTGNCPTATPVFTISATTTGGGDGTLSITNVPLNTTEGWTFFTLDTALPVGTGPVFGITPDANTFAVLNLAPVATPGGVLHWIWPVQNLFPAVPLVLPPGTMTPFAGQTWDFIALASGPSGFTPSNVSRVTW